MKDVKRILWADDEIDLLRPHILFLESRGYSVTPVTNGDDAISAVSSDRFDAVLLDEMMPGRGGLETLGVIQDTHPTLPIIMITKSEEEHIMNEAIGQRIRDYLTKPVNPSQILLALKRIFEEQGIQRTTLTRDYLTSLNEQQSLIGSARTADEWLKIGARFASWELSLDRVADAGLLQSHVDQKREANDLFGRFVEANYAKWVQSGDRPLMSPDLLRHSVFPALQRGQRVAFILIDCMRLDLWRAIRPLIEPYFDVHEELYLSILPTATPYARNSIFAGLFPRDIRAHHPAWWQEDSDAEGSLNRFERELLEANLERHSVSVSSWKYQRVFSPEESTLLRRQAATFSSLEFVALVFNFLDIMAHGRSDSDILRELAPDETAFRNLLVNWFSHSTLFEFLRTMSDMGTTVVITTDHGAVLAGRASVVTAGKDASTNLRYKYGSNLKVDGRQAIHVKRPGDYMLPDEYPTKNYLFAKENFFFVYPNNFHHYERQFRQTFQHGGVSLEEMVLPLSVLTPRR
jgi:CheY-like chemotaxis protein